MAVTQLLGDLETVLKDLNELEQLLSDITYEIDSALIISDDGGLPHEFFLQWCVGR